MAEKSQAQILPFPQSASSASEKASPARPRLGEILARRGWATERQLRLALQGQGKPYRPLGQVLSESGTLTDEQLAQALAEQFGLEYVTLQGFRPSEDLLPLFSYETLRRDLFLPYSENPEHLSVVLADPLNLDLRHRLEAKTGGTVRVLVSTPFAIQGVLDRFFAVQRDIHSLVGRGPGKELDFNREVRDIANRALAEGDGPVIRLVDTLLYNAIRKRASDIHLEVGERGLEVRYRLDGHLVQEVRDIPASLHAPLLTRLKVLSELNIAEKRIPQDGRFRVRFEDRLIDFRVSVLPTQFGEVAVIRILDKGAMKIDLETLGLEGPLLERFHRHIKSPYGMVLLTGPTGSGKTTTGYAALNAIKNPGEKIITVEDPIEYRLEGVIQVPVNEKKGLTFAKGLRSILRHDPDKLMVGEIRDGETAQIAVQAALTGHLVFTTIHANNVIDVVGRLLNMGIERYEVASALSCVMAQRLIRKLCERCKVGIDPKGKFKAVGCGECFETGYSGRLGIFELMSITDPIREAIVRGGSITELKKLSGEAGMRPLREVALELVERGITSLEEADRVTLTT